MSAEPILVVHGIANHDPEPFQAAVAALQASVFVLSDGTAPQDVQFDTPMSGIIENRGLAALDVLAKSGVAGGAGVAPEPKAGLVRGKIALTGAGPVSRPRRARTGAGRCRT